MGLIVNLRKYRLMHEGMTQQKLAELTGVTRQTIISIEKGKYKPTVELALKLAKALNATVEELFILKESIR